MCYSIKVFVPSVFFLKSFYFYIREMHCALIHFYLYNFAFYLYINPNWPFFLHKHLWSESFCVISVLFGGSSTFNLLPVYSEHFLMSFCIHKYMHNSSTETFQHILFPSEFKRTTNCTLAREMYLRSPLWHSLKCSQHLIDSSNAAQCLW